MYYSNIFDTVHACISVLYQCDKYISTTTAVKNRWIGMMEWNNGMEYWDRLINVNKPRLVLW